MNMNNIERTLKYHDLYMYHDLNHISSTALPEGYHYEFFQEGDELEWAKIEMSAGEVLTLEEGLKREWIITNGLGGYAASTAIGINTRKYHGLLVAPLDPPGRRFLLLSKLDESLELNGEHFTLATNMCPNYISEGFKNQIIACFSEMGYTENEIAVITQIDKDYLPEELVDKLLDYYYGT